MFLGTASRGFLGALIVAALVAILNAFVPPVIAAIRLPYTVGLGFILVLVADALMLMAASAIAPGAIHIPSLGRALWTALVAAVVSVVLDVVLGTNDDDAYTVRVTQRVAKRSGERVQTSAPGIMFLEIDGLGLPVLRRAMRDGNAANMARWVADGSHAVVEWETDLSSQTGASQAGILLGSNHDIPAFRWVEKETGRVMTCSKPDDCAEIESRLASRRRPPHQRRCEPWQPAFRRGRRGDPDRQSDQCGEAVESRLPRVLRKRLQRHTIAGAVLLGGDPGTGGIVRAKRRDVRPRGHRGGVYPFLRAAMCVVVRDLIVYGVLTDMMKGRPAIYATFSSYDEVAHHSGLERADTLEALRKLDQQFGRIDRARRYAARPYEIVVLSDHGQTQGATFKQRNGYGLADLVERSLEKGSAQDMAGGDEQRAMVGLAMSEATGSKGDKYGKNSGAQGGEAIVMGSGNLGLIYLMQENRRLTLEELDATHPQLLPALRSHPHVGWVLVRSQEQGPMVLGDRGSHRLSDGHIDGEDPLAHFSAGAPEHLRRTDSFPHVADIMVGSFYDRELDEGCAFEELISFHGGIGGTQTKPFILHPVELELPGGADRRSGNGAHNPEGLATQTPRRRDSVANGPTVDGSQLAPSLRYPTRKDGAQNTLARHPLLAHGITASVRPRPLVPSAR